MKTVAQLNALLYTPPYKYTAPEATNLIPALNQTLSGLNGRGTWKGNRVEFEADVSCGYVVLPQDYENITGACINNVPVDVHGMDFEYQRRGPGLVSAGSILGLIDKGYVALQSDLPADGLAALVFTLTSGTFSSGDQIVVNYTTEDGLVTFTSNPVSGTAVTLTPASNITSIQSISYTSMPARVVVQDDPDADSPVTYATLLPGEGVTQYRRYHVTHVPEGATNAWTLNAICKRAFIPVTGNSDIVYIDNILALKYGLLAVVAEDSADHDRAELLWEKAVFELEKELAEARGNAITFPTIEPWGRGVPAVASLYG